jgi:hypothetical protein
MFRRPAVYSDQPLISTSHSRRLLANQATGIILGWKHLLGVIFDYKRQGRKDKVQKRFTIYNK